MEDSQLLVQQADRHSHLYRRTNVRIELTSFIQKLFLYDHEKSYELDRIDIHCLALTLVLVDSPIS